MPLTKQPVSLNFAEGVNTKSDPFQLPVGQFLTLQNSVFDKAGRLTKRNGYAQITTLPNTAQTNLKTLNNSLVATGSNLFAYSADTSTWTNQGLVQPVQLKTQPAVRVSTSQSAQDAAVAASGLACITYIDNSLAYYHVVDSATGQQVVGRTALPATATNPRVFLLGSYFVITFMATVSATTHLQYIAIPTLSPSSPSAATDLSTAALSLAAGYDGVVANNSLYVAWAGPSNTIKVAFLTSTLIVAAAITVSGHTATEMSVTADNTTATPTIWITFWDSTSTNAYSMAVTSNLVVNLAPTLVVATTAINALTSVATGSVLTLFYEVANQYSFAPNAKTDFIIKNTVALSGTVGTPSAPLRSVGLASKAFIANDGTIYTMVTYGEASQPTYFLVNSSGQIVLRLAYANAGGYVTSQVLPSVSTATGSFIVPYLIKDFVAAVNKDTNLPTGTPTGGLYSQTGINLAIFTINDSNQYTSEIAGSLHLTGGQLWQYDGTKPVEHGFHLWPANIAVTTATGSGSIAAGTYYYAFTYEWTDAAGNLHRSAPSIPVVQTTTTSSSTNTLHVPTLRLTAKISPNPVRIVGYRWSVAQQTYYQFTSITSPILNDTTVDAVTITDTLADSSILGNTLLYTTGGVIEDIAAPASIASCLYKNRLVLIDAEDQNTVWYSKQVIQNTPVEMSDLFTLYVAPTTGAQGSTGPLTALSAMDDKLILFKKDALYYVTGNGPDITGANNDFSDPTFITSSVGTSNPASVVLTPNGLMFQSDKGIWLLGRDLSTTYIGAPVESFNSATVVSADTIPATNQVRFVLDSGITLMYDYYFNKWGTFTNVRAISATLYNSAHTYLNAFGQVLQETPNTYLDGSTPVLMSFTTAWINVAGLQGYERLYFMYLLGTYFSPFKLSVGLAYDYNSSAVQNVTVVPDNYTAPWGGDSNWGSNQGWGGIGNVFEARIFPQVQKCSSFQISVQESFDASFSGVAPGQGLSLSGLNLVVGVKKGYRTQGSGRSFG